MRVLLYHNDDAGDGESANRIGETLERYGHQLVRVVEEEGDLGRSVEDGVDVVLAAGGDGTVSAAARAFAGRGIPLAILPLGTANNIARSVDGSGPIDELIASLAGAGRRQLDLGLVHGACGQWRFVEAVGAGLIPAGIAAMDAQPDDTKRALASKLAHAVREFRETLSRLQPRRYAVSLDGTLVTGDFLIVEVLNIRSVGPNLVFAADATPSDGKFSVVLAGEDRREEIVCYLQDRFEGRDRPLALAPELARHVEIQGCGEIHVDDRVIDAGSAPFSIDIEPAALDLVELRRANRAPVITAA